MESMTGQLLVATPTLKDPNFDRTVVLMIEHSPEGALESWRELSEGCDEPLVAPCGLAWFAREDDRLAVSRARSSRWGSRRWRGSRRRWSGRA